MTTKVKVILWASTGLAVVLMLGAGIAGYVHERELRVRAETTAADNQKIIDANNQAMTARDKADQAQQQKAALQAAAVSTAPQAAKTIVQYVPVPVSATAPAQTQAAAITRDDLDSAIAKIDASLQKQGQAPLADAPSYTVMTQAESVATARKLIQCEADDASLKVCQLDKAGLENTLEQEKLMAARWEAAAKGGTRWQRIWGTTKKVGIGVGIGVVSGYLLHR